MKVGSDIRDDTELIGVIKWTTTGAGAPAVPHQLPTVEDLAPAAVVIATGLGAARQIRGSADQGVVEATAQRRMGLAPEHIKDLFGWVCVRLAAGAVQPSHQRCIRCVFRHGTLRSAIRGPNWQSDVFSLP